MSILQRMGDRVVDCARLESVCTARYQGFESPPIRHVNAHSKILSFLSIALLLIPLSLGAADNSLVAARAEYTKRNFDAAIAALDRFDQANPNNAESLDLRGSIYFQQQKFDDARKAFDAAHTANTDIFAPRVHSADVLMAEKKFAEAREAYRSLLRETNILLSNERLRFAILLSFLGEKNEAEAKKAFDSITFPTQSPAYYYAQAAWLFAHDKKRDAADWIAKAEKVYAADACAWFAQGLYQFGWVKSKPPLSANPN